MALTLNSEYVTSEPVAAATVMVVRDTTKGPEVLLLRRHAASGVLGGAYVFPGGKVDPAQDNLLPSQLDRSGEDIRSMLHEPGLTASEAVQILVAAIRETFEESGVLLGIGTALLHKSPKGRATPTSDGFMQQTPSEACPAR